MDLKGPTSLTRRDFLKVAGLAAGTLAVTPWLPQALASAAVPAAVPAAGTLPISVLVPSGHASAPAVASLLAGMQLYFDQNRAAGRHPLAVSVEPAGIGATAVEQSLRRLLAGNDLPLVAGVVSAALAGPLHSLLAERGTTFVACDAGAHFPRQQDESPHFFHHSLGYWQASFALGQWAAANLGPRALLAAPLFDSGYDSLYAFQLGLESAGGILVAQQIGDAAWQDGCAALIGAVAQTRPDFVFAAASGPAAASLLRAYAAAGLSRQVPLVGPGFLVSPGVLAALGDEALGVHSGLAWADGLALSEHETFVKAYAGATGQAPDAFAALGYDTGRLIAGALESANEQRSGASALPEALAAARFDGPRGTVQMHAPTHSATGSLYLRQVQRNGATLANAAIATFESVTAADEPLRDWRASSRTGFVNPYL